jgi:selenoprotein W-related protein
MDKFLGETESFEIDLIESAGGVFEVTLNDDLIFSKKDLERFPNENEIAELVERFGLI